MTSVFGKGRLKLHKLMTMRQFRFLLVGGTVAGFYFVLVLLFLHLRLDAALAAFLAYGIAFLVGYVAQKKLAFRSKTKHTISMPRYAALQSACAVSAALSAVFAESLGVNQPLILASITTAILGLVSYYFSSRWVFAK